MAFFEEIPVPGLWSAYFLLAVIALVVVLTVPSLRSRRWLVWTVAIGIAFLFAAAVISTYTFPIFWTF